MVLQGLRLVTATRRLNAGQPWTRTANKPKTHNKNESGLDKRRNEGSSVYCTSWHLLKTIWIPEIAAAICTLGTRSVSGTWKYIPDKVVKRWDNNNNNNNNNRNNKDEVER
jgi:hypothetical protein